MTIAAFINSPKKQEKATGKSMASKYLFRELLTKIEMMYKN